jgi:hypothetical protein
VRRAKAPGTTSGLSRKLHKDADTVLADFYQKDALDVLSAYITGSAKRAEFTRRFGVPGREGSNERADWQSANGHKDQLDVIRDKINEEILASGKEPGDAQQLINDILEGNLGILGKGGSAMRTSVSMLHAYNQIAKMDHSLITSFNELAMGFVRGGPRAWAGLSRHDRQGVWPGTAQAAAVRGAPLRRAPWPHPEPADGPSAAVAHQRG